MMTNQPFLIRIFNDQKNNGKNLSLILLAVE